MIPQLRFLEFADEWQVKNFDNVFDFSTGKNIKQAEASPGFRTPCVRYGELYHLYDEVIREIFNNTNLPIDELVFSKGNEILLPSAGEDAMDIGSASALTLKDVAIGRTINVLRPKADRVVDQVFASYYINSKLKLRISKLARGSSISNVYISDLKKLTINLPRFSEQEKIAEFLTAVDARVALQDKKVELLQRYKKSVMQKIFSQKIRFKDGNGDDYPDWKNRRLGELGDFKTSSVDKLSREGEKEVRLVNYMNVYRHENLSTAADLPIVTANETQIANNNLNKGDILFTPSSETPSDIGHSVVVRQDLVDTVYSYHLVRLRPTVPLDLGYSHYFCNTADVLRQIARRCQGSTRFTITIGEFSKISSRISLSLNEQQKIADFLTAIDDKINLEKSKLLEAKKFKKALLQRMFV
jgi:type I restriction enzyme S subunit